MRILPPFKIHAETDGNLGQTPIWSTGVTIADARLLSTVLLKTSIPLIRVENALRSFPEEKDFERGDKRPLFRAVSSARKDLNAGGSAAKKPRTNVSKDGHENVLHKLLELTAEASKWQARAEERAAAQQETRSQEIVTTERFTTATATAQKFAQELLTGITQNVVRRTNNLNHAIHVSVEAEESPGNSGSHGQRLNNNYQQIGQPA